MYDDMMHAYMIKYDNDKTMNRWYYDDDEMIKRMFIICWIFHVICYHDACHLIIKWKIG